MTDIMQAIGMLLVPLALMGIGFLYLALAFGSDTYINKQGQEYYCKLHPNDYLSYDASFWYCLKIEHERKVKNERRRHK